MNSVSNTHTSKSEKTSSSNNVQGDNLQNMQQLNNSNSRKFYFMLAALVFMVLAFVITPLATNPNIQAANSKLNTQQTQQVKALIKELLINDPDLLKEAIIALQNREQQGGNTSQQELIKQYQQALFNVDSDPVKGAKNPEITMAYFTDFNCPYCKRIEPSLTRLLAEYPQLKIVVKMVPLQGPSSRTSVAFAQTVWLNEPEKFAQVSKMLMASPRRLDDESIAKVAKLTNTQQWLTHTDQRVDAMITDNLALMRNLNIGGTPSLIFADTLIPGLVPYEQLKQQLERALANQGK